jgi:predicted DNA-binding transcriptional regulator YafY
MDIPVDGVRGRYGGYRLARHYRMPPLMLTDEEGLAVVWALLVNHHARSGPATPLALETATAKVRRVLPATLARRIDAVPRHCSVWLRRHETSTRLRSNTGPARDIRRRGTYSRTASWHTETCST